MERKYDALLLNAMKERQYEETISGVKILVKPIPEGGEPGDMDPRLYKSMKAVPLLAKLMPKPKKNQTVLEMVQPFRKMFNELKSLPIADEGLCTDYYNAVSADGYEVPVRVYRRAADGSGRPVLVYYHGGGFFGGSADVVEQMCKLLVQKLDCVVFNVDYRLCPENHYPQPLDDCFCATQWAWEHAGEFGADREMLAVGGDSAGGNLAAAVTLRDREEKTNMVKLQILLYPAINISGKETDFYHGVHTEKYVCSRKHKKVLEALFKMMGGMMAGEDFNMMESVYLQGHLPAEHIYASPLLDDMHDVPPTLLMFGEHDFLVFEDFAYAQTLVHAGRSLRTIVYRGLGHGFADQIGVTPQAEDCIEEIADYMNEILCRTVHA